MNNTITAEVEHDVSERAIRGTLGTVRTTRAVANAPRFAIPRDPQALVANSRAPRAPLSAGLLCRPARAVGRLARRFCQAIRNDGARRRSYRTLASLDSTMLRDIGVGRRENIPAVIEGVYGQAASRGGKRSAVTAVVDERRRVQANELNPQALACGARASAGPTIVNA